MTRSLRGCLPIISHSSHHHCVDNVGSPGYTITHSRMPTFLALLARPPRVLARIFRAQGGMRPPSHTYMAPKLQLIYYRLRAFLREECGKQV